MAEERSRWMPPARLTPSGRPVLVPGEVERALLPAVDLDPEENPSLAPLRSGLLALTSHRLLWIHEPTRSAYSFPLAAIVHVFPPKKPLSIRSVFSSPRLRIQISMPSGGETAGRVVKSEVVTVVMRGKTDPDAFYGKLIEILKARAWEESSGEAEEGLADARERGAGDGVAESSGRVRMPVVGVSGILRKEQEMWESTDKSLHDAFQDLNALMSKAKEMVLLAEKMRQKLLSGASAQANSNEEDMGSKQEMQDWLLSVGIISPVTKESAGALYHQQLARQLADFVKKPLETAGGMIALIDVYCLFNRARGTELISPEDMLQACAIWEKIDVPVILRKFDSGVMVIQNKAHSDEEIKERCFKLASLVHSTVQKKYVFTRITSLAQKPDALRVGISPSDAALMLGIAPALAKEHMLTAESKGLLCRDVSPDGFRFYMNLFKEIDLNDIYSVKTNGLFGAWVSATAAPV